MNESTLGTVPSATEAANAANAARATDAATLGGLGPDAFERSGRVRAFQSRVPIGSSNVTVAEIGPLRLRGTCVLVGAGMQLAPRIDASTSENDAIITASQFTPSDTAVYEADPDFDVGESLSVAAYQESGPFPAVLAATGRYATRSGISATFDVTVAGRVFSNNPSEQTGCLFAGSAIVDPA